MKTFLSTLFTLAFGGAERFDAENDHRMSPCHKISSNPISG